LDLEIVWCLVLSVSNLSLLIFFELLYLFQLQVLFDQEDEAQDIVWDVPGGMKDD
jgi:hypothetical protein